MDLKNKIALITGASSGIGLACAEVFLSNKIKGVALVDINEADGNIHSEELNKKYGNRSIFIKANVSVKVELRAAFERTVETFGNLDIVINSAGIVNEFEPTKCYAVNLDGVTNGTQLAIEEFLPKHKSPNSDGFIVNVSSLVALYPTDWFLTPTYTASKCAVLGLTMAYGTDFYYTKYGVRVIAICPGGTITPMTQANNSDKIVHHNEWLVGMKDIPMQGTNSLALNVVTILGKASNGSIWKIEGGKFEEMKTSQFGCF